MGFLIWTKDRSKRSHAAQTGAAGKGWTELNLYFAPKRAKMQTNSIPMGNYGDIL